MGTFGFRGQFGVDKIMGHRQRSELINLAEPADSLAFSHDGEVLVSGSYNGTVRLWGIAPTNAAQRDATTGLPAWRLPPP